jgi:phosphoenolpyruvate carboxylase
MDPLNKRERTETFLKFLGVFILGIIIVLIPFYFIIRLPERENKLMNEKFRNLEEQLKFQKKYFAVRMDSVKNMLDDFDSQGIDIDKLNADIGFVLSDMEKSIVADTSWKAGLYKNIIQTYLDLQKAKNSILETRDDLKECQKNLKNARGRQKPKDSLDS